MRSPERFRRNPPPAPRLPGARQLTYRYLGREFRLTDVSGRILHEIVA